MLLLCDVERIDSESAARVLEVPLTQLKHQLHEARQAMRGILDPQLKLRAP